jgi:integrase
VTRTGSGEGNIRRRVDGRWEARVVLADGRRVSFYGQTRAEVVRLRNEALRNKEQGLTTGGDRQTVEQFLLAWLQTAKYTIKPRTWRRYGEFIRLHIVPALGKIILSKLMAQQVQALYAQKLDEGLAPATVRQMHAVVHRALKYAMRVGLVARNVADMVDPPRIPHREMAILSEEQARRLLETARDDHHEALYILALATGMRLGELLALKWRDVDLDGMGLQVRATLQLVEGVYVFAEPKSKRSRRRIGLPQTAVEALRRHHARQSEERLQFGAAWADLDLAFTDPVGEPLNGIAVLRSSFHALLRRADLPIMRFHDLRHTAATVLLGRGVNPKVVSEMLGHSNISITLGLYGHVTPHMQQYAADMMDRFLGG